MGFVFHHTRVGRYAFAIGGNEEGVRRTGVNIRRYKMAIYVICGALSGTASIVGHETIHPGDVAAQTRETMTNINALLEEANRVVGSARYSLDGLKFKVYVRQPADLDAIENTLSESLRSSTPVVYLQADVCREDLLVEIEATGDSGNLPSIM